MLILENFKQRKWEKLSIGNDNCESIDIRINNYAVNIPLDVAVIGLHLDS